MNYQSEPDATNERHLMKVELDAERLLIAEFVNGGHEAFEAVYGRLNRDLQHGVALMLGDQATIADVEDASQEAWLRIYEKCFTFRGMSWGQLVNWVRTLSRRVASNYRHRFLARLRFCIVAVDEYGEEQERLAHEDRLPYWSRPPVQDHAVLIAEVRRAAERLSPDERTTVLFVLAGYTPDEMACKFGAKAGAVRMRLSRAIANLRILFCRPSRSDAGMRADPQRRVRARLRPVGTMPKRSKQRGRMLPQRLDTPWESTQQEQLDTCSVNLPELSSSPASVSPAPANDDDPLAGHIVGGPINVVWSDQNGNWCCRTIQRTSEFGLFG